MKIITTTLEDFVNEEISEWGFDYVEQKFAEGYEPTFTNGVWLWEKIAIITSCATGTMTNVFQTNKPINGHNHNSGRIIHNPRSRIRLLVR